MSIPTEDNVGEEVCVLMKNRYLESYTPDDNRYDLRPFLYPRFAFEHRRIENMLKKVYIPLHVDQPFC